MLLSWAQQNPEQFISDWTEGDSIDINQFLDECMNDLIREAVPMPIGQNRVRLSADSNVGIAGSITWTSSTTQKGAGYYATSNTINTRVIWERVHLIPGHYNIYMLGMTNTNCGIATLQTNEATPIVIGTIDWYQSPITQNVYRGLTNVYIDFSDYKDIEIKMATKHASSTGYVINFNWIEFIRTGD